MVEHGSRSGLENGLEQGIPADLFERAAEYDAQIPFLRRTVAFVKQYQTSKPKGRDSLCDQMAGTVLKDLPSLKHVLDNLDLVSQVSPEASVAEIRTQLFAHIETNAVRRSILPVWTPGRIEELIRLGFDATGELAGTIERVKTGIFNAPRSPQEAVTLHYNTAWAMVTTADNKVREELFSILCFEKPWFTAGSLGGFFFTLSSTFPDDATCEKYHAVIEALKPVGFLVEKRGEVVPAITQRVQDRDLRLLEAQSTLSETDQRAREKTVLQYIGQNPKRYAKFKAYVMKREENIISDIWQPKSPFQFSEGWDFTKKSQELKEAKIKADNYTWPENTVYSQKDPLVILLRKVFLPRVYRTFWESYQRFAQERGFEKLTGIPIQLTDDVELDVIAKAPLTIEQKQEIVREVYSTLMRKDSVISSARAVQSFAGVVDVAQTLTCVVANFDKGRNIFFNVSLRLPEEEIGRLSSVLAYHRPILTVEQVRALEDQIKNIRNELNEGFTKGIGHRGYTLIVSDPSLRRLGYKEITVNQALSGNKTHVKMTIDTEEYSFDLDSDYRVVLGQDMKQIKNVQDKVWLELITLSHLRKLMCTGEDETELKKSLLGGERQYETYRKQRTSRIEHLRRQAQGRNYSTEAFKLCLKSGLPVKNLYLINKMRAQIGKGGTLETGTWTYVSGTEYIDSPEAKPIRVAFKDAGEDIRDAIPLGDVSPEERNRIEKEILEELG